MSQVDLFNRQPECPLEWGRRLLQIAVKRHKPVAIFGLFSGGHDSLCATALAAELVGFNGAVHINTGFGIEKTREFVRATARNQKWDLLEYHASDHGQHYDELVLKEGFPGPAQHGIMYNRLKERALRQLVRDHKVGWYDRIMLVTGVRRSESIRRMATVEPMRRIDSSVWVAPLTWFDDRDKTAFMAEKGLCRNEVVDLLHMSGECLCGAFAKAGELEWLEFCGFDAEVRRIKELEKCAEAAGVPCRWGQRPDPRGEPRDVHTIDMFDQPLCVDCIG